MGLPPVLIQSLGFSMKTRPRGRRRRRSTCEPLLGRFGQGYHGYNNNIYIYILYIYIDNVIYIYIYIYVYHDILYIYIISIDIYIYMDINRLHQWWIPRNDGKPGMLTDCSPLVLLYAKPVCIYLFSIMYCMLMMICRYRQSHYDN